MRNSRLQRRFDVDVLEIQLENERLLPPLADRIIQSGDRLLIRITRSDLLRLKQEHTVQLNKNLNIEKNFFLSPID